MLELQHNVSLTDLNTLAIDARARYFCEITEPLQIPQAMAFITEHRLPLLVLGGGSNIVLTGDFSGLVLKISLRGINIITHGDRVELTAAAGENWHQLVRYCLANGYYGLENLSLIPGTAGAAPIQNIGAYGVEIEQLLLRLEGWDMDRQQWRVLDHNECEFAYRDSIFKHALKNRFIISSITLLLSTTASVNISYAALQQYLSATGTSADTAAISPVQVADAVIAIRQSKLPDPQQLANAGSFFKNPVVSRSQAEALQQSHPQLVCYEQPDGRVKLAAGWLLQAAGWKGQRLGPVGMHQQQSLVLINYAGGSGDDVLALARQIQQDIFRRFAVELEIEPQLV